MKIKAIAIMKLPRLITIPGLDIKAYRKLQAGDTVDIPGEAAQHLISYGFADRDDKIIETAKKTKAKAKKGGDK